MPRSLPKWVAILCSGLCGLSALGLRAAVPQFRLQDTGGHVHTAAEWNTCRAIVMFFVTNDCPLTNSYVPEMNRIRESYASRGVKCFAVRADASASAAITAKYAKAYGYSFPLLLDPNQILVRLTGATVTPEAVVLSPAGKVFYRGRIDNRVADFGKQRLQATVHDLRRALDAVLEGKSPSTASTQSIGCAITMK